MAKLYSPMPGAAMRILETTTCVMACLAAFADSPRRFPFSSVTGMPTLSSLEGKTTGKEVHRCLRGMAGHSTEAVKAQVPT